MRFVDLIEKKVNHQELTKEEIEWMISSYVDQQIPEYQMSAMLMAILFNGMSDEETANLTLCMMHSGDVVDLSDIPGIKLDKHSTGGVGDTTTLVVAPLVASCHGVVAKMSGRGLGHTGGTLDKLESIPHTSIEMSLEDFKEIVRQHHVAVIGQSGNLVPADKKLYALRDVTNTVRSIPLIASSIMSKKLASGADAIVLDVKVGSGAFMKNEQEARQLATLMVKIGQILNRQVAALLTDMNQPLGNAVGNALEVKEAVLLLSNRLSKEEPLYKVCMILAQQMLLMSGLYQDPEEILTLLEQKIEDGSALRQFQQMIRDQHGDESYLTVDKIDELIQVKKTMVVEAGQVGYITKMNAQLIGQAAQMLGAGRATKEDQIDPSVGLWMHVRMGDKVSTDTPLCTLYINDESNLPKVHNLIRQAITIETTPQKVEPMVYGLITKEDIHD